MARGFNQVILVGNLARDPELRTIPSGQSVASFAVATNRSWQDSSGETQEAADFHNITAWGKLAELSSQYLSKGRKVMIVGRLQTRSWEDDSGKKNYRTEVVANEINFLDKAAGGDFSDSDFSQVNDEADKSTSKSPAKPKSNPSAGGKTSKSKSKDEAVKIEDVDDLSDIPF